MRVRYRNIVFVVTLLVFAMLYLASPLILSRALSEYLGGIGVKAELHFSRPTLSGILISKGYMATKRWSIELTEARVDYSFGSLRQARVDLLEVQELRVKVIPANVDAVPVDSYPVVSPWQELPFNNLTIHQIAIQLTKPELVSTGSVRMTSDQVAVSMTAESPLLPAALFAEVSGDPAGTFLVIVGLRSDLEGDARVLQMAGAPVDDHLVLAGDLTMVTEVFDLLCRSLGLQGLSGSVSGQLSGQLAWPVTADAFSSLELHGLVDIDAGLAAPGYTGSDINGSIAFELINQQLQVSSKGMFIRSEDSMKPFRLKGLDFSLSPESEIVIVFESAPFNLQTQSIDELDVALTIKTGIIIAGDSIEMSPGLDVKDLGIDSLLDVFVNPTGVRISLSELQLTGSSATIQGIGYAIGRESVGLLTGEFQLPSIQTMVESPETVADLQVELNGIWRINLEADAADATTGRITINTNTSMVQENGEVRLIVGNGSELLILQLGQQYKFTLASGASAELFTEGGLKIGETEFIATLPEFNGSIRIHLSSLNKEGDSVETSGWITLRDDPAALAIKTELVFGLSTLQGRVRFVAAHRVNEALLNREIPGWVSQYDLTRGNLSFEAEGSFSVGGDDPIYKIEGRSELKDGDGYYDDIPLKGLAFSMPFVITDSGSTLGPGPVSVELANPGLPVWQVTMRVDATDDHVYASAVSGRLLGGTFNIQSLDYDLVTETSDFLVRLDGALLSEVLALEGADLSGDGVLDAEFRVLLGPDSLRVNEGMVQSRPPGGHIRYLGSASDGGNAGLKLALTALKNFQYESIHATPTLEDGNLELGIRLEGKNEEVESGRPIHFNLNINQNIPALLQSLQAHEKLEQKIKERATGTKQ
ncbi:MAG TPA: hypothetical protein EYP91_09180 [Gammaproteobacteria bacterium]|nr:hypothetical protein [Gammaproteobacteria bacterium]